MLIKDILESANFTPLYRGIDGGHDLEYGATVTKRVRTNRRLLDSSPLGAAVFDYGIQQALGVENIRQRALFATSSPTMAASYGSTLLKLDLHPSTTVVYNPNIDDSGKLTSLQNTRMNRFLEELSHTVDEESGNFDYYFDFMRNFNQEWYASPGDALEKLDQTIRSSLSSFLKADTLERVRSEAKEAFLESSKLLANNYVVATYVQLPLLSRNSLGVEVMIYGISEYSGTVVDLRAERSAS